MASYTKISYNSLVKFLYGSELAGYIKERQAKQVRRLRQSLKIIPKLAIVVTVDNPAINTYIRLKQAYGEDILVEVVVYRINQESISDLLNKLNNDQYTHGIIVQLPLNSPSQTEDIIRQINPKKDVDGLNPNSVFAPATPTAILWLLNGYNIELLGKTIVLVGQGKLVGLPLAKMLRQSGLEPLIADKDTKNLKELVKSAEVIISATGNIGLITSDMIKPNAVVVDAGVASEEAKILGDVDSQVYDQRDDLTITPTKGGVGPLTVCALFDNVIKAAEAS